MAATGTAIAPQVRSIAVLPLRIGFSWSLAGWVGYAACQWLMLSVLAKFGSPTIVGQFAFALALSAPIFMFTNLNLRGVQSTDALREYCFPDYVTLRLIGSAVALLAIISICPFLKLTHIALLFWLVFAGAVIANYDFRVARRLAAHEGGASLRFSWRQLQGLALTSLPLGFVSAIGSFNTNIPRYMIQHVLSVSELGIFASIAYPVTAATIIANSLGQSALARLSRLFAEGRIREFKHLVLKLIS